jgi:hypothetical protein
MLAMPRLSPSLKADIATSQQQATQLEGYQGYALYPFIQARDKRM